VVTTVMKDWVKVCGIQSVADAKRCFDAGVDAIGLNLWAQSSRSISIELAAEISQAVKGDGEIVLLTVNHSREDLERAVELVMPDWIQFHGDESQNETSAYGDKAFKAIGLGGMEDAETAKGWPGKLVLVDARDAYLRGGTGMSPPAELAKMVCAFRPTILAGGLNPDNVYDAILRFAPVGVDTASGVEASPAIKDFSKIERFVAQSKDAFKKLELNQE